MAAEHTSVESTQPSSGDAETQEQRRWLLPLGLELTVFSAALLALFASGIGWLVLLALAARPIAGPLTPRLPRHQLRYQRPDIRAAEPSSHDLVDRE